MVRWISMMSSRLNTDRFSRFRSVTGRGLLWTITVVVSLLSSISLSQCNRILKSYEEMLGTVVYLPDTNVLGYIESKRALFQNIDRCVKVVNISQFNSEVVHFGSTEEFYHEISREANLNVEVPSLHLSLQFTYDAISGGEVNTSSLAIELKYSNRKKFLKEDCVDQLDLSEGFLKALRMLPSSIPADRSWDSYYYQPFKFFMKKWGSHHITDVDTGSMLQQWSSAKMSSGYTQRNLMARACAELEGLSTSLSNVKGCAGVSIESKRNSQLYEMSTNLYVKGATPATRAAVQEGRTEELIDRFLSEGAKGNLPVRYGFRPIWEIIRDRFSNTDLHLLEVSRIMEAYYEGFLGFGCELVQGGEQMWIQRFEQENHDFRCVRLCQGCQSDKDCHVSNLYPFLDWSCYCLGPSCIEVLSNDRAKVRTSQSGSTWVEPNKGCRSRLPGFAMCACHRSLEQGCIEDVRTGKRTKILWSLNMMKSQVRQQEIEMVSPRGDKKNSDPSGSTTESCVGYSQSPMANCSSQNSSQLFPPHANAAT